LSQELERVYTINLGKVLLSPDNRRSKRAINMIREFARHHMKIENVKIDEDLSHQIWKRGIKHPPRKVRVRMTKTEEGYVLISPYEEEVEAKEPEKTKAKLEKKTKEVKPKVETKQVSETVEEVKPKEETKQVPEVAEKVKPKIETKQVSEVVEEVKPKAIPKKTQAKEEKPKKPKIASFVDPKKDPQHYINRYNKEKKYKEWFDKNYPKLTIEEAVGLKPSKAKEEKSKKTTAKDEKPKKKSS
jgi:large subunit ribosomal protein L31e